MARETNQFVNPTCPPQELPPPPRGAHYHQCACQSYLTCFAPPDGCAIGSTWECPSCEQAARDRWLEKQQGPRQRSLLPAPVIRIFDDEPDR